MLEKRQPANEHEDPELLCIKGAKGDTGEKGERGGNGMPGTQGRKGEQGTCDRTQVYEMKIKFVLFERTLEMIKELHL